MNEPTADLTKDWKKKGKEKKKANLNGLHLTKVNCTGLNITDEQQHKEKEGSFEIDSQFPLRLKGFVQEEQLLAMNFSSR